MRPTAPVLLLAFAAALLCACGGGPAEPDVRTTEVGLHAQPLDPVDAAEWGRDYGATQAGTEAECAPACLARFGRGEDSATCAAACREAVRTRGDVRSPDTGATGL